MKFLIIVQDSSIGRGVAETARTLANDVIGTSRRQSAAIPLDLGASELPNLPDAEVAIFCAAMSKFSDCRDNPDLAYRINVEAPSALARALARRGTHVILRSTAAVFDGSKPLVSEKAMPNPTTGYGKLKAQAEQNFLALNGRVNILRMTKVLDSQATLITGWRTKLARGEEISAFEDLLMAPVVINDAVAAIMAVSSGNPEEGIYQLSASSDISYLETARWLASRLGAPPKLVQPASAAASGIPPNQIVRSATLDGTRLMQVTGKPAPDFYSLDKVFGNLLRAA